MTRGINNVAEHEIYDIITMDIIWNISASGDYLTKYR
jgi:hypothetical protein